MMKHPGTIIQKGASMRNTGGIKNGELLNNFGSVKMI